MPSLVRRDERRKPVTSRREAIHAITGVLPSLPIVAAALCGSFARDSQTKDSDIDLLVAFDKKARISDVEAARSALERATGRPVDLITTLDGQTGHFKQSVLRDGLRIYG